MRRNAASRESLTSPSSLPPDLTGSQRHASAVAWGRGAWMNKCAEVLRGRLHTAQCPHEPALQCAQAGKDSRWVEEMPTKLERRPPQVTALTSPPRASACANPGGEESSSRSHRACHVTDNFL